MNHKKQNGVYYTPEKLADFIVNHVFQNYFPTTNDLDILEPSCGDGVFIKSIISQTELRQDMNLDVTGIELDQKELNKIRRKTKRVALTGVRFLFENEDFLKYQKENTKKYDLVIGNPPYINKKYLLEEQKILSNEILKKAKIEPSVVKNIWIAFLISSVLLLKENGVVCFILPSELLQVKHSSPIRDYLFKYFRSIEIFTFNEIVFEGIEQDTIIFLGSNRPNNIGLKYSNIENLENFRVNVINEIEKTEVAINRKWTSLVLSNSAYGRLEGLRNGIANVNNFCVSGTGIVTAANESFIVSKDVIDKYGLNEYAHPIIKKSSFVKDSINFTKEDFELLVQSGVPTNLLLFSDQDIDQFSEQVQSYLEILKTNGVDKRYKCKKRQKWFIVPSVWSSEGVFFKRSNLFPKVIVNEAKVLVTDTAYRITMRDNYNMDSFAFSFYNSLTLVYAELYGRFYGGGVLELTPNEFKNLPLPYVEVPKDRLSELDRMFRDEISFEEILSVTNSYILKEVLNFTDAEIHFLNETRRMLIRRRLKIDS
ncbi:Eco57I restriction-modification methylase domain-containing protein [Brevibacillus invocatus]|uniref:Eco57I restriction-modification methylase domain-containing protein n=1 Tax=Brevibacillus invocatus TaxID=173959 RepID=UPI00203EF7A2|nr:N-6 DNA methylase [Brevibacillus invocatus]MCM3082146.1 N-6 DNA methylase [Brevibacillus invocatus]MCM3432564.1 N-6 DNA methylase [Brevibacillus invocatus]